MTSEEFEALKRGDIVHIDHPELPEHHDEYTVAQRIGDIVIVVRSSGICEQNRKAWPVGRYPVMVSLEAEIEAIKAARQNSESKQS